MGETLQTGRLALEADKADDYLSEMIDILINKSRGPVRKKVHHSLTPGKLTPLKHKISPLHIQRITHHCLRSYFGQTSNPFNALQ
jgi:hypothetical protein